MGEDGRPRGLGAVDLIPAVVAHARVDDRRGRGVVNHDRNITGRVEEGEVGRIEEGRGPAGAFAAEDAAALAAVLLREIR